jgi:hypothetical protein
MSNAPDAQDPLEAELAALRPADLPPELIARVGRELSGRQTPARRRWVIAAVATAACLLIAAVLLPLVKPTDTGRAPGVTVAATTKASPAEDGGDAPALFAYRRAIAGPPSALDELLDRHAARGLPSGPPVTASTRLAVLQ